MPQAAMAMPARVSTTLETLRGEKISRTPTSSSTAASTAPGTQKPPLRLDRWAFSKARQPCCTAVRPSRTPTTLAIISGFRRSQELTTTNSRPWPMEPPSRPSTKPPMTSATPTTSRPQPRIAETNADALSGFMTSTAPKTIIRIDPRLDRCMDFQLIPLMCTSSFLLILIYRFIIPPSIESLKCLRILHILPHRLP